MFPFLSSFLYSLTIQVAVSLCLCYRFQCGYNLRSHIHQHLLCICHGIDIQSQFVELIGIFLDPLVFLALGLQTVPLLLQGAILCFHVTSSLTESVGHIFLLLPQTFTFLTLAFLCCRCFFRTDRKGYQCTNHSQDGCCQQDVWVCVCYCIESRLCYSSQFGDDNTTPFCSRPKCNCRCMCFFLNGTDAHHEGTFFLEIVLDNCQGIADGECCLEFSLNVYQFFLACTEHLENTHSGPCR